ncbi:YqaJ viral recombinase family protein [Microbacterium oleivorans]|uniref:YqaJ viral recombinase domain-containing protein n=1 Tax=Microbacterium oleivorans TaxID=273677 RepID=A0A4R5YFU2_9MICO|nr:YqaJ viral recombinase family protein [Microbacterium oleivorans]TDL43863.1 hypothetical protein E2R54_11780 [Microbacterium oleivorans]
MDKLTIADRELMVVVADGAPEAAWHDGRDEGVTASEIHAIASGSMKTRRRILDGKLNGSIFTGNAHTRRGHAREGEILAGLAQLPHVLELAPSNALYASHVHPLHRATPDGLGIHEQLGPFGVEVKSHTANWTRDTIPVDHLDQIQFGMWVLDLQWWLYAWEVEGEGIRHRWVTRDDRRIAHLIAQANDFIAWRAAGAPELGDLPDEVDEAITEYARGLALASEGEALKKQHAPVVKEWALQRAAVGEPLRREGSHAQVFAEPKPEKKVLDEDAWSAAEPDSYAEVQEMKRRIAETEALATTLYHRLEPVASTFRITPNGDQK